MRVQISALVFSIISVSVSVSSAGQTPPAARKQARATRISSGSVHLDGRLDESFWETAEPLSDFVQAEPVEGAPPTDRMDIRFVYDDTALWIGARMDSTKGGAIQASMSRRDDGDQAEYLQIELDTYLDRRTAYMFGVTASGVRLDHFHPTDDETTNVDAQFDPVWEAKTSIDDGGWSAELWLPFSQLRFNDQAERVWGLNVKRWRPTLNEEDYWIVIGRTASGWASRFGELRGIDGVRPRTRVEFLPYVASSSRMTGNRDRNNPFDDGVNLGGRVGADFKMGIGSNLTLDATINPDFGQIEADPAEVNLTVFETLFAERRPFFLEGNNVLRTGNVNYFYSRRIGGRPIGPASGDYVDYPDTSTILGAAKLTGRLHSGTLIGVLGAVTDEESASVSTRGIGSDVKVEPRTMWSIGRVIQEFGGGSTIGGHVSLVHRNLDAKDPLSALRVRTAVTAAGDGRIRFLDRTYEAFFSYGLAYVEGEPAAIERVQRANGHLLQRVDQPTIRLDPTRRSLLGFQTQNSINKIAGKHWLWGGSLNASSPEWEPTDFGRLVFAGDFNGGPRLTFRQTQPGRIFRAYSLGLSHTYYWSYDLDLGLRQSIGSNNSFTLRKFWVATFNMTRYFRGQDPQLTRGGPAMEIPRGWNVTTSLRNSTGSKTSWNGTANFKANELGDTTWSTTATVSARPHPSLQFSVAPEYLDEHGTNASSGGSINRQYLTTIAGGRPATYGSRYIFGLVDRRTISTQFRVNYTFKPDVTLDLYMEPFAASGRYDGFGELAVARGRDLRMYGTDGTTIERLANGGYRVTDGATAFTLANQDFNVRSFRSNVVLRWEWRPGSTLFVVWQQNRAANQTNGDHVGLNDLFGSFSAPGDNIFALKTTVWLSR